MTDIKPVTEKEQRLIRYMRAHPFSNFQVYVQDGQPLRIEKVTESIKIDSL